MRVLTVMACLAAAITTGCGCTSELVEASFTGTATGDAAQASITGVDALAPSNTEDYEPLRDFVIEGRPIEGHGVTWTVLLGAHGHFGVHIPTSRRGDVLPLVGLPRAGGWAISSRGEGAALVNLESVDRRFVTASGQGTLTVVGMGPLRVRIEATFVGGNGAIRHLTGEARFRLLQQDTSCYG